jgi:hypothetical protein
MIVASKSSSCSLLGARFLEDRPVLGALIDPIQYQAVQMNVQIGCRAEALNEGDRAGVGCAAFQSGLLDQKCRDDPMNDLQQRREQLRMGGQQDARAGSEKTAPIDAPAPAG